MRRTRGFTLVELMIVVAIIGILAGLGVYSVRKYLLVAKTAEPIETINAIRAAQEAYKDETFSYLSVTPNIDAYYPMAQADIGAQKWQWGGTGNGEANWRVLGVTPSGPVQFGYACVAGAAGGLRPGLGVPGDLNYPATPTVPWYVIKARGDRDEDGVPAILIGSSFTDQIHIENEAE